jgi:hypothetical protein
MGLRYGLQTARDLFDKLQRDVHLLDEEVTSDRMFNLVVTARHLPEWIEKESGIKRLDELRDTDLFKTCRDIADASKHFELEEDRAKKTKVDEVSSRRGFGVGRYGKGGYGVGEESISIKIKSQDPVNALEFARRLIDLYTPFFECEAAQGAASFGNKSL